MSIVINGKTKESLTHEMNSFEMGMHYATSREGRKYYEPQRSNTFELIVTGLDDLINPVTEERVGPTAQETLRLSVVTTQIPHFRVNVLEQRRGNSVQKFAGTVEFPSGSLKCHDWIGAASKDILMAWLNEVYDEKTDKIGLIGDYKLDAYLVEYTPDMQAIRIWEMNGVWPSDIQEDDLDHNSSEARMVTSTFNYDRARLLPGDTISI